MKILNVLNHIHERNIFHRNISLENVIFREISNNNTDICVINLSNAELCSSENKSIFIRCGKPGHMAPEMF